MENAKNPKPSKEGMIIPAGTEQETGLTRGQTEKPEIKKEKSEKNGTINSPKTRGL